MFYSLIAVTAGFLSETTDYVPVSREVLRVDYASIVEVSSDMSFVAVACAEKQDSGLFTPLVSRLVICQESGGKLVVKRELPVGPNEIRSLAFSPSERFFVAADTDGNISVWRTRDWVKVRELGAKGVPVSHIAFLPVGDMLVSCSDKAASCNLSPRITIWNLNRGNQTASVSIPFPNDGFVTSLSVSSTGEYIASGGNDGNTRVWSSDLAREVARISHDNWVSCVRFSPSGKFLSCADQDGKLRIVATDTWNDVHIFDGIDNIIEDMEFVTDDLLATCGGDWQTPEICLWDVRDRKLMARIRVGGWEFVSSAMWSNDRVLVLSRIGVVYSLSLASVIRGQSNTVFRPARRRCSFKKTVLAFGKCGITRSVTPSFLPRVSNRK